MKNLINSMTRKLYSILARGVLRAVNDSGDFQTYQLDLLEGEPVKELVKMGNFGFASNPPKDSQVLVFFNGGDRSSGVVIATENPEKRIKNLSEGDSAIYSSAENFLKAIAKDNSIQAKSSNFKMDCDETTFKSSNEFLKAQIKLCELLSTSKTSTSLPISQQPLDKAPEFLKLKETFEGMKI